jgi:serine/threonine protein kinase/tetratricopeptide (TPR) repeat protein
MKPAPISVESPKAKNETDVLAVHSLRMPSQIGPYKILKLIGRGGMGSVYRAKVVVSCQVPIGQEVALKLLRETDEQERKRFARESTYLQDLYHPGIVRVLDNGEYDGQPYLVMQLVEGHHADDLLISGKPVDQNYLADLAIQALDALHVAHLHGILHRDIKPGNIMISEGGQVKLVDFGLAQYMNAAESHLTATGAVVGTPAYMSPEQASGQREVISRRSDVYSMGACLYELLTGKQPFSADNSVALLRCIIEDRLVPPSVHRKDLARDFETIVLKSMAKDWRDRYSTANEMAADLRRFRLGVKIRTARPNFLQPLLRAAWQQRSSLALIALMIFIAISTTALVVRAALKRATEEGAAIAAANVISATPIDQGAGATPINSTRSIPSTPIDPWVEVLHQDLALDEPKSPLRMTNADAVLGKDLRRTVLPAVSGPVRLSATIELLDNESVVELMISDRDIGLGYRVRIIATKDNDRLELLRESKVVRSRDLGQLVRGRPMRLSIERVDDTITAILDRRKPLLIQDIIPVEGLLSDGVQIAFVPRQVKVSQVKLERQRTTLFVSPLAKPDSLRQSGYFSRAKDEYENFINDHPDALEVRDAQLRIALCLEGLGNDEQALVKFDEVASAYREHRSYVLTATFHAWACALRLGRMPAAEEYFEAIRYGYDLATLLPTIPEATIKELVSDYRQRANQLTESEPDRAARLFISGAEIASYLNQPKDAADARGHAGNILLARSQFEQAAEQFREVANDDRLDEDRRRPSLLLLAHAERLSPPPLDAPDKHVKASEAAYRTLLDQKFAPIEQRQWARLWLGDLRFQIGDRDGARTIWSKGGEAETLPGKIMYQLWTSKFPLPLNAGPAHIGDVTYFNARLAQINDRTKDFRILLEQVKREAPLGDWRIMMANQLLEQLNETQPPAVLPPEGDPPSAPDLPEP